MLGILFKDERSSAPCSSFKFEIDVSFGYQLNHLNM